MTSKELRIGNIVLARGAKSVVKSIDENHVGYLKSKKAEEKVPITLIQPIPLTEEWLVKFGFEKGKSRDGLTEYSKSIRLVISISGNIYYSQRKIAIKHVHQLQNFYWCLCGKELTNKN